MARIVMKHYVEVSECLDHDAPCFTVCADLGTGPVETHLSYHIVDCPEHPDCTVIVTPHAGPVLTHLNPVTFVDGAIVWSHAPSWTHPECRLNDLYPKAIDARTNELVKHAPACSDCGAYFLAVA